MTDKFWVTGGSGLWGDTDNWSGTSGGGSGVSIPIATDNVKLDGNSGSGTVIVNGTLIRVCEEFNCTGFTGTLQIGDNAGTAPTSGKLNCSGNIILVSGMTLTDGGGTNTNHWLSAFNDVQEVPQKLTSGGKTIPFPFVYGGGSTSHAMQIQDTWVHSGTCQISVSDTSAVILDAESGSSFIEAQGTLYYGFGSGIVNGNCKIKCTGTGDLIMNGQTGSYQMTLDLEFTSGTRTLKSAGSVGNVNWTYVAGTVIFDPTFVLNLSLTGTMNLDVGTSAVTITQVFFRTSTKILNLSNTGHNITIADFRVSSGIQGTIDNGGNTNPLIIGKWNAGDETLSNVGTFNFIGDITFDEFYLEWTTTSSTFTWDNTATYIFRERFETLKNDTGFYTFTSDDGTLRPTFHIWHNCRTHLYGLHCTRINALWIGQGMDVQGETTINDCLGVFVEVSNKAIHGVLVSGPTENPHPFYSEIIKDPVFITGTVELSASAQQDALVFVIMRQTEDGKQWYKLIDVLVTDVNGKWETNVPRGSDIFIMVQWDNGGTKYNSLSKPYVVAS